MKILCLQLARFGDIYQTWPVLRALRRNYPEAEIHLLVRSRFIEATVGLDEVSRVIALPTNKWLAGDIDEALAGIEQWLIENDMAGFDRVINLSFSPLSSYLVDLVGGADVVGYTRQSDGFLSIPDEPSAYFYAQVGVDRANRIHLSDLFAMIAGVELTDDDFRAPALARVYENMRSGIVVQVGASQSQKTLSAESWMEIIKKLTELTGESVTIVGSAGEFNADAIQNPRVLDRVGQTKISELFQIIADARLFIGCDSVGLHIAALTQTPTLNISFAAVRFWETGPRAPGSRILWFDSREACDVSRVTDEALRMCDGEPPGAPVILKAERSGVIYDLIGYEENDFSWELVRALYSHENCAAAIADLCRNCLHERASAAGNSVNLITLGFTRMSELATLALEQIKIIESAPNQAAVHILDQVDALIEQVGRLAIEISPLVRWFQTEKSRIPPGGLNEILKSTKALFDQLNELCQTALLNMRLSDGVAGHDFSGV